MGPTLKLAATCIVFAALGGCRIKKREPTPAPTSASAVAPVQEAPLASAAPAPAPKPEPLPEPVLTPEGVLVIVLGGADSHPRESDATLVAVDAGVRALVEGGAAIDAATAAVVVLEDLPNFNAGTGSVLPVGSSFANMDAAVADSTGRFGAVASLDQVKNPVLLARRVAETPQLVVAGKGAQLLADRWGFAPFDPITPDRRAENTMLTSQIRDNAPPQGEFDWRPFLPPLDEPPEPTNDGGAGGGTPLVAPTPSTSPPPAPSTDTVLAIVRTADGAFAAAASTGGPALALAGRVSDVPVYGAAIFVGDEGAVAVTGSGEQIARLGLARRIYERMQRARSPVLAAKWGVQQIPGGGVAAMNRFASALELDAPMAWAKRSTDKVTTGAPPEPPSAAPSPSQSVSAPSASAPTPSASAARVAPLPSAKPKVAP